MWLSLAIGWLAFGRLGAAEPPASDRPTVLLVVGAPGEPGFATNFMRQVELWQKACRRAGAQCVRIGHDESAPPTDRDRLQQALAAEPVDAAAGLWLVLIGHGTFDGKEARFNLRGPDVSATELAAWLKPLRRPQVIIDTTAASAPFLNRLSATNRVVITATRSGNEQNFAHFGGYFAAALDDPQSDLDHDGETSLLESFLSAAARLADFYKTEGRLATEHPLIDDNGDGLGTPAEWFRGVRAVKRPKEGGALDGVRAQQIQLVLSAEEQALPAAIRAQRDALELSVAHLREAKAQLPEDAYYRELERLLLQIARITEGVRPYY